MNTNDLLLYIHMYETQSINKTALITKYAQSNVSNRLKSLENEFGYNLFIRTSKGLSPTQYAKRFYQYAKLVLNETEKIKQQQANNNITISELLFNLLVLQEERYPIDKYHFDIKTTTDIAASTQIDNITITFNKLQMTKRKYKKEYLEASFLTGKNEKEKLPILINSDDQCPFRQQTLNLIENQSVKEINSLENIISLVCSNKGIALLPIYFKEMYSLKQLNDNIIKIPYYIYQ